MLLFFDLETTGIPSRRNAHYSELAVWPRIVSISWAVFQDPHLPAKHFHTLIRPDGFLIPPDAQRVHGITTDRARRDGAAIHSILSSLLNDVKTFAPALAIAHNIAFDRPILLAEFLRARLGDSLADLPTWCAIESSVLLCRLPRPGGGYKWPTLDELHRHLFHTPLPRAHDAATDVLSCAKCYFKLAEMGLAPAQVPQAQRS